MKNNERTGEIMRQAAPSTVEALMYELRTDGLKATMHDGCLRRLNDLSKQQLGEIIERLFALSKRGTYPAITPGLLLFLDKRLRKQ